MYKYLCICCIYVCTQYIGNKGKKLGIREDEKLDRKWKSIETCNYRHREGSMVSSWRWVYRTQNQLVFSFIYHKYNFYVGDLYVYTVKFLLFTTFWKAVTTHYCHFFKFLWFIFVGYAFVSKTYNIGCFLKSIIYQILKKNFFQLFLTFS